MHNPAFTPTSFIGRSQELDEMGALLDDSSCRLLTLVGQGGIGKTRLAQELALRKKDSFPDGVFFVPLVSFTQGDDLLSAIAEATPFRFQQDDRDSRDQFFDYLREKQSKRMLLVLDNFEQLLDGVDTVSDILDATANLKILVTSREALNLQEEWVRQIEGLAYPNGESDIPLGDYPAVQLFVDRACQVRGDLDLDEEGDSVLEICRLVEGMPLAIELAAGWLKTLHPADIAEEIRQSIDILVTRSRNLPERHRSIRSVFNHSWRLMSDAERVVFQKLSVFRSGFTREAAEVVAGASLHTLAGLVDKSLVRLNEIGRYDIHELLRQYGAEQLAAAGQTDEIERAYVAYYLGMMKRLEGGIKLRRQIVSLDTIFTDFENVRSAWQLAVQQGQYDALGGAVESLQLFADMRGRYNEVVTLLHSTVEHFLRAPQPEQEAALHRIQARLVRLVVLGNLRIDFDLRAVIDVCVSAARQQGSQLELGFALMTSAIVAVWEVDRDHAGSLAEPRTLFEESYEIFRALGDLFYQGEALIWLGVGACYSSDGERGIHQIEQSLILRREIGDRNGIAWISQNLSEISLANLDYVGCERHARQALELMREIGSLKGILQSMFKLSMTTMLRGSLEEARTLAEELRDRADEANNLDGKMLAAGLLSFLISVMDENYEEGAAMADRNHAISLEPFFATNDVGAHWGRAVAHCGLGDFEAVRQSYDSLYWDRLDDPGMATVCMAVEAAAQTYEGELERAVELLGAAFHQPVWVSGWLQRWALAARLRTDLESRLGKAAFQAAWERGAASDVETVIRSILDKDAPQPRPAASPGLLEPLSDREREVLELIADGLSNRDIAERLVLSVGTVKVHTRNIYGKLHVNSRTQAIAQATRYNLL